jgi:hypothetical protein
MANRIGTYMENYETKFIKDSVPIRLDKPDPNGKIMVTYQTTDPETNTKSEH